MGKWIKWDSEEKVQPRHKDKHYQKRKDTMVPSVLILNGTLLNFGILEYGISLDFPIYHSILYFY